jgi:hypothetical protein
MSYGMNPDGFDERVLTGEKPPRRDMTRAEMRRRLAASERAAYRLLAKVRRPDLLPFASARIAEAIGVIEMCRGVNPNQRSRHGQEHEGHRHGAVGQSGPSGLQRHEEAKEVTPSSPAPARPARPGRA